MGTSKLKGPDNRMFIVSPDDAIIDHVLANPGIDVRAYLLDLHAWGDPRVTIVPLTPAQELQDPEA